MEMRAAVMPSTRTTAGCEIVAGWEADELIGREMTEPAGITPGAFPRSDAAPPHQQHKQDNQDDETEAATAIAEMRRHESHESTDERQQDKYKNNDQDGSQHSQASLFRCSAG